MYPFAEEDNTAPASAEAGAQNVPTAPENTQAQGAGDYFVGPMPSGPAQGPPAPQQSSVDPATLQALQQRLQAALSPQTRFQQIMRSAAPIIAGAFAPSGSFGSLMTGYTNTLNNAQLEKSRQAQEDLRLAAAIKDLQAQERAQAAIDARAQAQQQAALDRQAKERELELRSRLGSMLKGGLAGRLNTMIDNGEDVQSFLSGTIPGQNTKDGSPLTTGDLLKMYGQQDPDGIHYLDTLNTPKESKLGTETDTVQRAVKMATAANGGKPLTDEATQAVVDAARRQYKHATDDPTHSDAEAFNLQLRNTAEKMLIQQRGLEIKKIQADLDQKQDPAVVVAKKLGPEGKRIADMDSGIQEAERLRAILKNTGLDQDNNPIGPRLANLAAKQGINMGYTAADLQQGAAYTKSKLFMTLAAGNAGRSKIMYDALGAHLPDGIQTGKQMAEVLDSVSREYNNARSNILRAKGVQDADYPLTHPFVRNGYYVGQLVPLKDGRTMKITGFDKDGNPQGDQVK